MKTNIFDFYIPENLIAQNPTKKRSDSRLLIYDRKKDTIIDSTVKNLLDFIDDSFFLVFNNSKVIPSRIIIKKKDNQRTGEFLILKIIDNHHVEVITDKSKKYRIGTSVIFPDKSICVVKEELDTLKKIIYCNKSIFTIEYFEKYGNVPLPPYIKKKPDQNDKKRYQTIYSEHFGSSAAPTAGLHFDNMLFNELQKNQINYSFISLHVGLGTFQPIYAENIKDHKIHNEEYFIKDREAKKINQAISEQKIIIPVGTTSLRTLETAFCDGRIVAGSGESNLYIYPSYNFKVAKGLFTNFHTPKSSLIVLVSAFIGVEKLLEIYEYAVQKKYRFFSYGDAMLIL